MLYVKPGFYDDFHCLAGKCPDTCCAGWQIAIDDDSLERYAQVKGPFGNRLYRSIDWKKGVFHQDCGHCSLLTEDKLCGLYPELGGESLCTTCREYPRHVEEFLGRRELSLGLSCPEAARLLVTECKQIIFKEYETEEEEELLEEFDEFDSRLFVNLSDARKMMFRILRDRGKKLDLRMDAVLSLARELQDCLDEGREEEMGDVVRSAEESRLPGTKESRYARMCRTFPVFRKMETLREEWPSILEDAWEILYDNGEKAYKDLCREFQEACREMGEPGWEPTLENLAVYFIYIYLCGAVYDGWVYSKAALAIFLVCWIQELVMARWVSDRRKKGKTGSISDYLIELTYRLAREAEHSDQNLDAMEEWLQEHKFMILSE